MPDLLFVCTANLCRSPMAEHLARSRLAEVGLDWSVTSAGTRAIPGRTMHLQARAALERRGIQPATDWATRRLDPGLIRAVDLILVAEPQQRGAVALLHPAAIGRTFNLLGVAAWARATKFAETSPTAELSPQDRSQAVIDRIRQTRAAVGPAVDSTQAVPDPTGRPLSEFEECRDLLDSAIAGLVPLLAGDSIRSPSRGG